MIRITVEQVPERGPYDPLWVASACNGSKTFAILGPPCHTPYEALRKLGEMAFDIYHNSKGLEADGRELAQEIMCLQ